MGFPTLQWTPFYTCAQHVRFVLVHWGIMLFLKGEFSVQQKKTSEFSRLSLHQSDKDSRTRDPAWVLLSLSQR